ncbi:hypothetical protein [Halorubrum sp. Hd13]|uniref:hypothetical protein n=1 Tax=Halorubrum sp. Hd13 TaxID=1480728 RepID=UPI00113FF9F3|nr:hypothetical protein [Halorubrum sp. Hd13]
MAILDACRYDAFERLSELPGALSKRRSKAPSTVEYLRANFSKKDMTDTVYVTANPQFYRVENGIYDVESIGCWFHEVVNVWKDGWDEDARTVHPERVTQAALKAAESYPNKRLLIHYMQPHAPYIGPTGRAELPSDQLNFWGSYRRGHLDIELDVAWRAYDENLELVLEEVSKLFKNLTGRIVVTSDHGELLGDRSGPLPYRKYGHPKGIHVPELVEIPWLVYSHGSRPRITAEGTSESVRDIDEDIVVDRLRSLGYAE